MFVDLVVPRNATVSNLESDAPLVQIPLESHKVSPLIRVGNAEAALRTATESGRVRDGVKKAW